MKNAIKHIIAINKKETKSAMEVMVKLQEETGELAAEMLKYIGKKGSKGLNKKQIRMNILEEGCDTIITVVSVLEKFGFNDKDLSKMIIQKCQKWAENVKKYKEWEKIK